MKMPVPIRRAKLRPVPIFSGFERYLVTLMAGRGEALFGTKDDRVTRLSIEGEVARLCWCLLPTKFPSVSLDTFMILPDRLCGIIEFQSYSPEPLSKIVRSFKLSVSRRVAQIRDESQGSLWQEGFEIFPILSDEELRRIRLSIVGTL